MALTAVAFGFVLATPSAAAVAVRYAEPGGTGPEPCLRTDPCEIEVAVESAMVNNGDEVVMLPGDYVLADELQVTDDIVLHGEDGQPRPRIVSTAPYALSTNFTSDALIRDLEIQHSGANVGLNVAVDVTRVEVHSSASLACAPFFPMTIRDSVCHSTGPTPSAGLAFGGGGGPVDYDFRAVNVTAMGTTYGISVSTNSGFDAGVIASNVIAQGGTFDVQAEAQDASANTDADVVLDHSNYQTIEVLGAQASVTAAGSGTNQLALPVFANLAAGDFHQAASSPTIDGGGVVADLGTLDFDREPRVVGVAPDIGADEFVPPAVSRCAGKPATKVGTAGRDRIRGTAGRDVIAALAGRDTVRGLRGNDLICGGRGKDRLLGGPGRDVLLGQAGPDFLRGGPGRDRLRGGPGRDTQAQ